MLIKSKLKDYSVFFIENNSAINELAKQENVIFILDDKVYNLYKNTELSCLKDKNNLIKIVINENKKFLENILDIYDQIMQNSPKKNITLVAIGGGIIQDIVGFIASTLFRGVKWIFFPTTLLAQDDSCIGGKTSLNYKSYKNLLGTFYPPENIYIYPEFLKTLTETDYLSGVGEMAKLLITGGQEYIDYFTLNLDVLLSKDLTELNNAINKCLLIKKEYIEEDEFDTGKRNLLNYGHCFGHAIEAVTDFAVPHGQAIVFGMIMANYVAAERKLLSKEKHEFLVKKVFMPIINIYDLKIDLDSLINAMKKDKKAISNQGLPLVFLQEDGVLVRVNDLNFEEVEKSINYLQGILK